MLALIILRPRMGDGDEASSSLTKEFCVQAHQAHQLFVLGLYAFKCKTRP